MAKGWKENDGETPALEWRKPPGNEAGKNAADIDLAFAAGELLHTDDMDCFCIASGDSDFSGLAQRLRDAGKTVIGMVARETSDVLTTRLLHDRDLRNGCVTANPMSKSDQPS